MEKLEKKIPKIVVMIPTSRGFERSLLYGIAKYVKYNGPWALYMDLPDYLPTHSKKKQLDWLTDMGIDGIIARIPCMYDFEDLVRTKIPFIFTNIISDIETLPSIVPDCECLASIALEYFFGKGFTNLGFCGFADSFWCHERAKYFSQYVRQAGYEPHIFFEKSGHLPSSGQLTKEWKKEEDKMIYWLSELPKPIGILTSNDDMGRHVIQNCSLAGMMVPEEVAVLGNGNDILVCELSEPQLSSIVLNGESCGYQAAEILHRMMEKKPLTKLRPLVKTTNVVTRRSTDVLAINDPHLARALNFISQNFKCNIKVTDVARAAAVSTRVLQNKFRKSLARSPYEEITRVRMEKAITMLTQSNLPISNIAYTIGFEEIKYFTRLFSKTQGITPTAFRKKYGQT